MQILSAFQCQVTISKDRIEQLLNKKRELAQKSTILINNVVDIETDHFFIEILRVIVVNIL